MPNEQQLADRMMRRLCAFPSFRPNSNPDMAQAYTVAILGLLREFGSERTGEAIETAINLGGQFPPSAGDLRKFIPIQIEAVDETPFQVVDERKLWQCEHGLSLGTACEICGEAKSVELKLETIEI